MGTSDLDVFTVYEQKLAGHCRAGGTLVLQQSNLPYK